MSFKQSAQPRLQKTATPEGGLSTQQDRGPHLFSFWDFNDLAEQQKESI